MDATQPSPVHERGIHDRGKSGGADASSGAMGAVYGLGFIGAATYWIQAADSFVDGLLGVLKALVWPAFLVYDLLDFLGA